jgi:hypothetical protein
VTFAWDAAPTFRTLPPGIDPSVVAREFPRTISFSEKRPVSEARQEEKRSPEPPPPTAEKTAPSGKSMRSGDGTHWTVVETLPQGIGFADPYSPAIRDSSHIVWSRSRLVKLKAGIPLEILDHGSSDIQVTSLLLIASLEGRYRKVTELVRIRSRIHPTESRLEVGLVSARLNAKNSAAGHSGRYRAGGGSGLSLLDPASAVHRYGVVISPDDSVYAFEVIDERLSEEKVTDKDWDYEGEKAIYAVVEQGFVSVHDPRREAISREYGYAEVHEAWRRKVEPSDIPFVWKSVPDLLKLPEGIQSGMAKKLFPPTLK